MKKSMVHQLLTFLVLCVLEMSCMAAGVAVQKSWSRSLLNPESPDEIDASSDLTSVRKAYERVWDWEAFHMNRFYGAKQKIKISSCVELSRFLKHSKSPFSSEWYGYLYAFSTCTAMDEIIHAKPARHDLLQNFSIDESTLKDLTNEMLPMFSNDESDAVEHDKGESYMQTSKNFPTFFGIKKVLKRDALTTEIQGNGVYQRLRILGYADVNGDGYQDVLVTSELFLDEGTWHTVELFALTRIKGQRITIAKHYPVPGAATD